MGDPPPAARRDKDNAPTDARLATRRGLRLVYATIAWNAFEGAAAIAAGIAAHSVALTGYGLDSSLEVFVSGVAAWQLRSSDTGRSGLRSG